MKTTNTPGDNAIGKKIRTLRLKKGWSQGQLGKALLISTPAVSKIEAGLTTINMNRIKQVAGVLNTTVLHFLTDEEQPFRADEHEQIKILKEKISTIDKEILRLQETAIKLYEELLEKRRSRS